MRGRTSSEAALDAVRRGWHGGRGQWSAADSGEVGRACPVGDRRRARPGQGGPTRGWAGVWVTSPKRREPRDGCEWAASGEGAEEGRRPRPPGAVCKYVVVFCSIL